MLQTVCQMNVQKAYKKLKSSNGFHQIFHIQSWAKSDLLYSIFGETKFILILMPGASYLSMNL